MPYFETKWEREHLNKKKPKPNKNVFGYNPRKVVKPSKFQSGLNKNALEDSKRKALAPGKRISKNGKVYYEYRVNHSDIDGSYK